MLQGTYTALVTPFKDGALDRESYRRLIDRQFESGINGVVPVGTTGESPTVSYDEHFTLIELAVEYAAGRGAVIAGTGSNSTKEAIETTCRAEKLGATHALLVAPYYNRPPQQGLYQHFRAIAEATALPLILYSIPGRCGVEIGVETTARLAANCTNIVAIKEAGGNVERVHQLRAALPDDFSILCGDDALTLPFMASGAQGVISVAANLIPEAICNLVGHALDGDFAACRDVHYKYYSLFKLMLGLEVNPIPIKAAMAMAGLIDNADVRLPLCQLTDEQSASLRKVLESHGLLA